MAEADYLLAAMPDRHVILGTPLRPFSLGHMFILRRWGNSFVLPNVDGQHPFEDLLRGVFVCAHTYEEALESLQDDTLPEFLKAWGEQVGEFDVFEKMRAFGDYITKGSTTPEVWETDEEARTPGAPFLQRLKLILTSQLGHSESEALNKPFGLALWDCFGLLELKNRLKLVSEEDREARAEQERELIRLGPELERIEAELKAKGLL